MKLLLKPGAKPRHDDRELSKQLRLIFQFEWGVVGRPSVVGLNFIGWECCRHDLLRFGPRLRVGPGIRVVDVWSGLGIFGAAYGRTVGVCSAFSPARVSYALLQLRFRGGSVSCGDRSEERRVGKECRSRWLSYQ